MLQLYVLCLSVFRLSVVCVLDNFILSRNMQVIVNILRNSSILESAGSKISIVTLCCDIRIKNNG